jgi:hypothetical protein
MRFDDAQIAAARQKIEGDYQLEDVGNIKVEGVLLQEENAHLKATVLKLEGQIDQLQFQIRQMQLSARDIAGTDHQTSKT